jgi:CheY-like chemotaxis protein
LVQLFFLGITGNALPEDMRIFKESGVDDVLIKPLSKAKLLAAFEQHLKMGDNAV